MMRARAGSLVFFAAGFALGVGAMGSVLPIAADGASFERALTAREFVFPRDHGAHPSFAHEWWYLTGHFTAASGERFGFELTFFRVGLAHVRSPPAEEASRWRTQQMYLAHFALTDISRGQFRFQERYARDALGLAGASTRALNVWIDDWVLADAGGHWHVHAAAHGYAIDGELTPEGAPVLNGVKGLSQKSSDPDDASYYYSMPRLALRGQLTRDGRSSEVSGSAWLDREWGSGALAADEAGWDWFALQLADGSELMFYSLRRRDGRQDPHSAGTWVAKDGAVRALAGDEVKILVQEHWMSPRGGRYPARWKVEVPALALAVELRPVLADQELAGPPRYWEGAVAVSGSRGGRPVGGQGYVELVGYARSGLDARIP